ncbi:MAG: hypothetical protein JNK11_13220 [Alphaproteobacteria bacterium]|nr:hypothetical protein [Alphaproteobacteria bacterium]
MTSTGLFARVGRKIDLMGKMMQRLGVPARIGANDQLGTRMFQATRACLSCRSAESCEAWFAAGAPGDAHRTFCPNAGTFERIASSH